MVTLEEGGLLFGLAIALFIAYGYTGRYRVQERISVTRFVEPVALALCAVVVLLDALLAAYEHHFVSALASVSFMLLAFSESSRKWKEARHHRAYIQKRRAEKRASEPTAIDRFWDRWEKWWTRWQQWRESAQERKLVAQEKARILAERELAEKQKPVDEVIEEEPEEEPTS